jgi:hypothetical protein
MLDQPTQAYYPSEIERRTGVAERDSDREGVRRRFRVLYDIAAELSPNVQVIVCDHANLPEEWFRQSAVHNWRDGAALIPQAWLTGTESTRVLSQSRYLCPPGVQ